MAAASSPAFSNLTENPLIPAPQGPPETPLSGGRRRARSNSLSSSPSSLSSSPSSISPTPSPFSSAVPFSWEHQPGIPKPTAAGGGRSPSARHLPLPPPLRTTARTPKKNLSVSGADPFEAALAECAKDPDSTGGGAKLPEISRRPVIVSWLGLIGFYASCGATCSVSPAAVVVPRSTLRSARSAGPTEPDRLDYLFGKIIWYGRRTVRMPNQGAACVPKPSCMAHIVSSNWVPNDSNLLDESQHIFVGYHARPGAYVLRHGYNQLQ
ncbi:hypothetical protein AXF42_Ash013537 [Apostasia shenzhenica]|uniref:Uncharacterized protein n=1 Tax=Apostasia shenzhenica TaxID=1088818 RepID=A0A2I0AP67_9ASPA|nr:hypothetical protein AXF42_Ash013537 [Apostasia shenzhenica]